MRVTADQQPGGMDRFGGMLSQILAAAFGLATNLLDDISILRVLILRNLKTKYQKNPLGLILEFIQPVVICSAHYNFFVLTGKEVPANQYVIFTIGGFTVWFCFMGSYRRIYQGPPNSGNITSIPRVTDMHLCLAAAIWSFCVFFLFANIVAYPLTLFGFDARPPDILLTTMTYGMAAGMGFGFALLAWALATVVPAVEPFIKLFRWAIFITSGIYDSIVTESPVMAPYIWYNPLIHLAEYQRHAFYPGYPVYLVSLTYPACWTMGLIFCGLFAHRAIANRQPLRAASE